MVVLNGFTETTVPVTPPGFQVNESAPTEVRLIVFPEHTLVFGELTRTEGVLFTDTVTAALPVHTPIAPATV
jgi:hypothetical protein